MNCPLFTFLLYSTAAVCAHDSMSSCQKCVTHSNKCQPCDVTCRISDLRDLFTCVRQPRDVLFLDLSMNGLAKVPDRIFQNFTNLLNLSLSDNKIRAISREAFYGLKALRYLNLAENGMLSWENEFAMHLPRLISLDITGNAVIPHGHVLELTDLKEIKGVTWDRDCTNCVLLRNGSYHENGRDLQIVDLKQGEFLRGFKGDCRADRYSVKNTSVTFAKHGFLPVCVAQDEKCFHSEISVTPIHRCWETDNYILNVEFLIATLGLLLNAMVFVSTFSVKSLRNNVSMRLIGNMAISDFLISAYSVAITGARKQPYIEFLTILTDFCRLWGLVWLVGQLVTVATSVLLTLERYWAVINYAKPSKRMTSRRATAGILFCWLMALTLAVLPLVGVGVYTSNTYCIPIRPRRDIPRMFEFSIALTLFGIALYFITLSLYIKMYLFVRKSSHRIGVSRESALAKRIAMLVISNMVFFIFPLVLALLWLSSNALQNLPPIFEEILTGVVPTICFSINSFINPLLSAFRHDHFKRSLRKRLTICRQTLGSRCSICRSVKQQQHSVESDSKENHLGIRKHDQLFVEECLTHL